jgi:hypothetical protein
VALDRSSRQEVGHPEPAPRSELPRSELPPSQEVQVGVVASTQPAVATLPETMGVTQSATATSLEVVGSIVLSTDGSGRCPMGAQQRTVCPAVAQDSLPSVSLSEGELALLS